MAFYRVNPRTFNHNFARLDRSGDGAIDYAGRGKEVASGSRLQRALERADQNHDGKVTRSEAWGASQSLGRLFPFVRPPHGTQYPHPPYGTT